MDECGHCMGYFFRQCKRCCLCGESIKWYAASDDIVRIGPFESESEAWEHLELTDEEQERCKRVHAEGAHVWPERGATSAK